MMRPEPWGLALDALVTPGAQIVVPSPAGALFTQATARSLGAAGHLIFACGRYEGIDQRVLDHAAALAPVHELSLGDYVLFGGEVAVLVMVEAIARLLPGVLGNAESWSTSRTRPACWRRRSHQAGGLARAEVPECCAGRPRPDRPLAPGSGTCPDRRPSGRSVG
jgi:tRNA G37 N-methylase TrmD